MHYVCCCLLKNPIKHLTTCSFKCVLFLLSANVWHMEENNTILSIHQYLYQWARYCHTAQLVNRHFLWSQWIPSQSDNWNP